MAIPARRVAVGDEVEPILSPDRAGMTCPSFLMSIKVGAELVSTSQSRDAPAGGSPTSPSRLTATVP